MTTDNAKTTFVLVPGAWHPPSCFDLVAAPLRTAGYRVVCPALASVGAEPPVADHQRDVAVVRRAIEEETHGRGQDVVVFMHSYGGLVGTEACRGLAHKRLLVDAEKEGGGAAPGGGGGGEGGVVKLIYCAALMLLEGRCLADTLTPPADPWNIVSADGLRVDVDPAKAVATFYHDVAPPARAAHHAAQLRPHSAQSFLARLGGHADGHTDAAWRAIPSVYVFCGQDRAIDPQDQRRMVEAARASLGQGEQGERAAKGLIETVMLEEASHSPFLSMPGRVVEVCVRAAEEAGSA